MLKNYLHWINLAIGAVAALLVLIGIGIYLFRPSVIPVQENFEKAYSLPKRSFEMESDKYEAIGPPFLKLEFNPATIQIPDLRRHLTFYGRNDRPDANEQEPVLHFGLGKEPVIGSMPVGKPLYLTYRDGAYTFSPDNEETTLWIETESKGEDDALIHVKMRGEEGQIVTKPVENAEFELKKKRIPRWGDKSKWELGGNRVDASLLARQKARWYGKDRFLEKHGGLEYKSDAERERIDFGDGAERYSIYVKEGDTLVWKEGHWERVIPGQETRGFPLLVVMSIDNRLINFDLWDVDGKGEVKIRLLKSTESWAPKSLVNDFKFIGARTRSQFVFEIGEEKLQLSPHDWLLLTEDGWKKLSKIQEIDDYVDRKEVGVLFVLDGVSRVGGRQMLTGTLFNSTRTAIQPVELPMQKGGGKFVATEEIQEAGDGEAERPLEEDDNLESAPTTRRGAPTETEAMDKEQIREMMNKYRERGGFGSELPGGIPE